MDFPFKDVKNTYVFTCRHIIEDGKPILYACHDNDGIWQFMCGADSHTEEDGRIVSLYSIYKTDNSIGDIADMPCGCYIERTAATDNWKQGE